MLRFYNTENKQEENKKEETFLLTVEIMAQQVEYIIDKYTFENFNSWINSCGYFVEIFDLKDNRRYGLRKDSISNYSIEVIKED